jgi:hypothetical protein
MEARMAAQTGSATARVSRPSRRGASGPVRGARARVDPPTVAASAGAVDREFLLARLANLRTIVPVFAQELAGARREAAALRRENLRLLERIRELQRLSGARR